MPPPPPQASSLFGPANLTLRNVKDKRKTQDSVNRANTARKMFWDGLEKGVVVVLVEDVRAKNDRELRGLQRRVRYGKKVTDRDYQCLRSRLLSSIAARGEAVTPFVEESVFAGYRHTLLDARNERAAPLLAKRLGSKLIHVLADDRMAPPPPPKGERAPRVDFESLDPLPPWLTSFMQDRPGSFTQTLTGKIATSLPLILGAPYMIWLTPGKPGGNIGHLGGCNGALGKLVGIIQAPGELSMRPNDSLRGDGEVTLSSVPPCLLLELEVKSLLKGRRVGGLPFGVVPFFPVVQVWRRLGHVR